MPEQEKKPMAATEQSLPGAEQLGGSLQQEDNGAADISPLLIIPPVIIAAVMSLALALVYGVTKEPIAEAKRKELNDKLSVVMPAFDNDPGTAVIELSETVKMYTGRSGDEISGFAFTSLAPKSYSGGFSVIFGIDAAGKVNKVRILESKETPGLGSKADPFVVDQLEGVDPATFKIDVVKDGGEVDAVSGATITSRAVCQAVALGLEAFDAAGGAAAAETVDAAEQIEEVMEEIESGAEPEVIPSVADSDPEEGSGGN